MLMASVKRSDSDYVVLMKGDPIISIQRMENGTETKSRATTRFLVQFVTEMLKEITGGDGMNIQS